MPLNTMAPRGRSTIEIATSGENEDTPLHQAVPRAYGVGSSDDHRNTGLLLSRGKAWETLRRFPGPFCFRGDVSSISGFGHINTDQAPTGALSKEEDTDVHRTADR